MSEDQDDFEHNRLKEEVTELRRQNKELKELLSDSRVAELEEENEDLRSKLAGAQKAEDGEPKKWQRGMLSSNEYIKIDPETGEFVSISKEEWNQLT